MTTESLIQTHNELAVILDRDTITRWKKTEPALRTLIASMKKELADMRTKKAADAEVTEISVETPKSAPKAPAKKVTKKEAKKTATKNRKPARPAAPPKAKKATKPAPKKATKAATKPTPTKVTTTTVVEIAAKLNINPKVARAKLRRRGMTATDGRWTTVKIDSKDH